MNNISEILKNAPAGLKLWSMGHGYCTFYRVFDDVGKRDYIRVFTVRGQKLEFMPDGRLTPEGECLLFPSETKDWDNWQEILMPQVPGTVIVDSYGDSFLFGGYEWYPKNPNELFSVIRYHKFDYHDARFATKEESEKLIEEIKSNGFVWNEDSRTLEKLPTMTKLDELKALQKEIEEYGKYLEESTYNPYDKVQHFSRTLKEIINKYEEDTI